MKRREIVASAFVLGGWLSSCSGRSFVVQEAPTVPEEGSKPKEAVAEPARWQPPVEVSLRYFQKRAVEHRDRCQDLLAAIRKNDLVEARRAYLATRPSYEQIEILAAAFEQTDRDIDARPAVFPLGETDPEFRGVHRIEALVFRDEALAAALPYAEALVQSAQTLIADLQKREAFSAKGHLAGAIALANEVGAKKITSEEETWSEASLLIFRENWRGIWAVWEPFRALVTDPKIAQEVEASYQSALQTVAKFFRGEDSTTFTPYAEVGVAPRRAIVQATYRLRDSLQQAAVHLGIALS